MHTTLRRTGRGLVIAGAAACLVAMSGVAGAATPGNATAKAPRCTAGVLKPKLSKGDAGAGQRYAYLTLTNRSKTTCVTGGYVGLQLMKTAKKKATTKLVKVDGRTKTLAVKHGQSVRTLLHWSTVSGKVSKAKYVRVAAPKSKVFRTITWKLGDVYQGGRIEVRPLWAVK